MGIHFTQVTDQFTKNDETPFGRSLSKASAGAKPAVRQAHRETVTGLLKPNSTCIKETPIFIIGRSYTFMPRQLSKSVILVTDELLQKTGLLPRHVVQLP